MIEKMVRWISATKDRNAQIRIYNVPNILSVPFSQRCWLNIIISALIILKSKEILELPVPWNWSNKMCQVSIIKLSSWCIPPPVQCEVSYRESDRQKSQEDQHSRTVQAFGSFWQSFILCIITPSSWPTWKPLLKLTEK